MSIESITDQIIHGIEEWKVYEQKVLKIKKLCKSINAKFNGVTLEDYITSHGIRTDGFFVTKNLLQPILFGKPDLYFENKMLAWTMSGMTRIERGPEFIFSNKKVEIVSGACKFEIPPNTWIPLILLPYSEVKVNKNDIIYCRSHPFAKDTRNFIDKSNDNLIIFGNFACFQGSVYELF